MVAPTAVIVAAGLGTRFGERTREIPKGMIDIGGVPLLRRSVMALQNVGVAHVRIVTGHLSEVIQAHFADDADVDLIYNPRYDETGSLLSLATGLTDISGPVWILESDIIYQPRGLTPMLDGRSQTILSGTTNATDEVYVWTHAAHGNAHQLLDMSKAANLIERPHYGELTGLSCISADHIAAFREVVAQTLREDPAIDYEPGLVRFAQSYPMDCTLIEDLLWHEVDNEAMLANARAAQWDDVQSCHGPR